MPYCPVCREEFRAGISRCDGCGVELVDSLQGNNEMEDLSVVCTIIQEDKAHIVRGFLESEGIPCQLENVSFHAGPAPAGELTKVRLWSKTSDVERARRLIQEHEQFTTCSSCGHVALGEDEKCDFCGERFELE